MASSSMSIGQASVFISCSSHFLSHIRAHSCTKFFVVEGSVQKSLEHVSGKHGSRRQCLDAVWQTSVHFRLLLDSRQFPLDHNLKLAPVLRALGRDESCHGRSLFYHSRQNNYRCKSLINSKTISVSQKNYRNFFLQELTNSQNNNVRMNLQTLQILQIFIECKIMVG